MKRNVTVLVVVVGIVGGVALAASPRWSAATIAQGVLGLTAVGLAGWWSTRQQRSGRFQLPPRMQIVQRLGLGPRSGLTLVQVDGRAYLVLHGEGFAQLHPTGVELSAPVVAGGPS